MTDAQQPSPDNGDQSLNATEDNQVSKIGKDGGVEFVCMEKADLKSVPVFVQALDNQWLPRQLLKEAQSNGQVTRTVDNALRRAVRSEYIRSLINGEQVIINRAFLYNNPAISQDYDQKNSLEYRAIKALLDEKTIIPFLLYEQSPIEKPAFEVQKPYNRWVELCQEVRTHCVRLSWDTNENQELMQNILYRRFHQFVMAAPANNIDTYLRDLGLDASAKDSLRNLLVKMAHLCLDISSQGKLVTRNDLYKTFITGGSDPTQRHYENSPLIGEIKQLLDLSYNSNLPDALDGYLITPVDSLPRIALQEWQRAMQRPTITGPDLLTLLRRTAFNLIGQTLNVPSMDILQLHDVLAIRAMEEWRMYIHSLQALLNHPEQFADGLAAGVYHNYGELAKRITELVNQRGSMLSTWIPTIELNFNIAGAILSYRFTDRGPRWRLQGKVVGLVAGATAPIVGKLVIRDMAEEHPQQDLSTGVDFMRFKIPDVQEHWKYIEAEVRKMPGFQDLAATSEVVDPTISYKEPQAA